MICHALAILRHSAFAIFILAKAAHRQYAMKSTVKIALPSLILYFLAGSMTPVLAENTDAKNVIEKPERERLIYKIDDHRYFTMLTENKCFGGGPVWYHDTQRNIHSEIANTTRPSYPFTIDSDQYLAFPPTKWREVPFSTDYGKTWQYTPEDNDGPSAFTRGVFVVYEEGIDEKSGKVHIVSTDNKIKYFYINITNPMHIDGAIKTDFERGRVSYNVETKKSEVYLPTDIDSEFRMDSLVFRARPTDFDASQFIGIETPSGWTRFRCDPMPKDLQGALR